MNQSSSGKSGVTPAILESAWSATWDTQLFRSAVGSPLLPVEYVASQGPSVRLIDIRDPHEFIGPLGYIPGSDWIAHERIGSLPERLERDAPLVVVSRHGERASEVARMLEGHGLRHVAALAGGIAQWLSLGFSTTRDPEILERCDVLRTMKPPSFVATKTPSLAIEHVEEHLGDPLSVRWIKLAALVLHAHQSCIDGRDDRGVLGTPGGDAGQFLLALAAIEATLQRPLDSATIAALLQRRIDALGGFYMHTDHHAMGNVAEAMRGDSRLEKALADHEDPRDFRQFLRRPPLSLRDAVLEHLCQSSAIGCGHIRLMHELSADYQVRQGLVVDVLRAFFRARWEGSFRAEYESLQGGHGERAVLNTRVEGKIQPFSLIPLVSPSAFGCQMFVNHPQVSEFLLRLLVDFLVLQTDLVPELAMNDVRPILHMEVAGLHAIHVKNSLGHLAKGLPIYDVIFESGRPIRVVAAGTVG
jgi:rhodanese-related sulfurtransferase